MRPLKGARQGIDLAGCQVNRGSGKGLSMHMFFPPLTPKNNKKCPSGALTRVPGQRVDLAGTQGMQEVSLNKDSTSFQTVPSPCPQH